MTTCPQHAWNQPCPTCMQAQRHEDDRLNRLWTLGRIGSAPMSAKAIRIRTARPRLAYAASDRNEEYR
jgi:hypothetical protein